MTSNFESVKNQPERPAMSADYGISKDSNGLLSWSFVVDCMNKSRNYWISSTRPDGRPHAMPVWGVWMNDTLYFGTSRKSVKANNLKAHPLVSAHTESGDEAVIIEGVVEEVTDRSEFNAYTTATAKKYAGMPVEAEPDPGTVIYKVIPKVILAWREKDFPVSSTRWRFRAPD